MLAEQAIIPHQTVILLIERLQAGDALSHCFRKCGFPQIFVSFIHASEEHGDYVFGLKQCQSYYESAAKWKRELVKAALYPLFVFSLSGMAFVFLVLFVMPRFSLLYQTMGIELPLVTLIMFSLFSVLKGVFWLGLGMVGVGSFGLWVWLRRSPQNKAVVYHGLQRLPLLRLFFQYRFTHYFAIQLGSLLKAGVPLLPALAMIRDQTPWLSLQQLIWRMEEQLQVGKTLYQAIQSDAKDWLPTLPKMVAIGEKSGKLDELLLSLAQGTEQMMKTKADRITRSIEPVLIFCMGIFIAFTVIAMFMPMLELVRAI